jgi:hypothetical protein
MSAKVKRLYRVTATYPDGHVWRRDYQSSGAAKGRSDRLLSGVEFQAYYDHMNGFTEPDAIPPASSVTITASDPITWSAS